MRDKRTCWFWSFLGICGHEQLHPLISLSYFLCLAQSLTSLPPSPSSPLSLSFKPLVLSLPPSLPRRLQKAVSFTCWRSFLQGTFSLFLCVLSSSLVLESVCTEASYSPDHIRQAGRHLGHGGGGGGGEGVFGGICVEG